MHKKPKLKEVTLNQEEHDALMKRLKASNLSPADAFLIVSMCQWYVWLQFMAQEAQITLKKLRDIIGWRCRKAFKRHPKKTKETPAANTNNPHQSPVEKTRKRNHGRNSHKLYTTAVNVCHSHEHVTSGDACPKCGMGKMYRMVPNIIMSFVGNALITAQRHIQEKFRCARCGYSDAARLPQGLSKYMPSSLAALVVYRYYAALPFFRIANLQTLIGVLLPRGSQWHGILMMFEAVLPVFLELFRLAANAQLIHFDDTWVRVLEFMAQNEKLSKKERKGMFTTGILAKINDPPTGLQRFIVLFLSGRKHAGENMKALLKERCVDEALVTMSDALTCYTLVHDLIEIICKCLSHALRKFYELEEFFPDECGKILYWFRSVYKNDEWTKEMKMTPEDRLLYHQTHSTEPMRALKQYCEDLLALKKVEPNSALGRAINYTLKNWHGLTRFLHAVGCPLDNNELEQLLKLQIRSRKSSLFYKTEYSAFVSSVMTTLVATCDKNKVNPFQYLEALYTYQSCVAKNPKQWFPWTYQESLARLKPNAQPLQQAA